jgi:AraC family transcriptional regulator of adaptative response/methylated-DNA-[protein]-cysteine methyltransferase
VPPQKEMLRAFLSGDAAYVGVFYTGVRTTGIFCLPTCTARKPLPQNVEFFPTVKAAMFAGYRACKRCRPTESSAPEWAGRLLAEVEQRGGERIREASLREMGLEPARVRRYFLREYGMTFQAYCRARRLGQAFEHIRKGAAIDDAVFDSGFASHSGFREAFGKVFGAPPGDVKASKSSGVECIQLAWIETPLGPVVAGAAGGKICLLEFTDRRMLEAQFRKLRAHFQLPMIPGDSPVLRTLRTQIKEYFDRTRAEFSLPLEFRGSPFEESVWKELLRIPAGETRSYQDIARAIGNSKGSRAVGRANGMNRIAILIPCHRVVNQNGDLGGYGGGLWRKRILLDLERGHVG